MAGLLKEIDERRAKRALSEDKIPDEVVARLMKAATYAPSCFNSQPWRFMVVTEGDSLGKLHDALSGGNYWAKKAPMLVVVATKLTLDARLSDSRDYAPFGCGLATENLLLQAFADGLYAHPMAGFDPLIVKEAFDIPEDYIVITLIAIGYPGSLGGLSEKHVAAEGSARNRKAETEVISYNSWSFE
ncbi:MAG: nitroreductase family protein [Desulfobacterales bacterium]|nr:nitroreductase family protein [Deltaproteobacteria bacterium]MBT8361706.1 nitroreductase family protein [Deltaproteobacteria bacterium]NNK96941.1 nitroreductase family protein [Desulfobacterales bacterium]